MKCNVNKLQTAPEGSQPVLAEVEKAYQFISNLFGGLAESPLAARAYRDLSGLIQAHATLSPQEQQVVTLTASFENGCNYTNHLAHTPVDVAFAAQKWTRPPIITVIQS